MKNKILVTVAVVVITFVAIFGSIALIENFNSDDTSKNSTATAQNTESDKITFSSDKKTVNYDGVENVTALATMQSLTTVKTQESAYGTMVVGINGVNAEDSKTYWAFYVNDTYASEGAGTYKAKAGDKIKWQLEAIQL